MATGSLLILVTPRSVPILLECFLVFKLCAPRFVGQESRRKSERKRWKRSYRSETREHESLVVSRADTRNSPPPKTEKDPRNQEEWEPVSVALSRVRSHCATTIAKIRYDRSVIEVHLQGANTNFHFDLCRCLMWTLNWIFYEPIWKQCYFRNNINEPLLRKCIVKIARTHSVISLSQSLPFRWKCTDPVHKMPQKFYRKSREWSSLFGLVKAWTYLVTFPIKAIFRFERWPSYFCHYT